jgi:hypothetical protein
MKKQIYFSLFLFLLSCGAEEKVESKKGKVESSVAVDENPADAKKANEDDFGQTTMIFDKEEIDLGNVKKGSKTKAVFTVTNTGKNPLNITNVQPSCGCTTASKPEKPIPPGGSDKIEVVFEPKPDQTKEQTKSVTITANTDPAVVVLKFKAFVLPN